MLPVRPAAQAAPITFNFTFSGANLIPPPPQSLLAQTNPHYPNAPKAASGNSAVITGSITFESTLLNNPGNNSFTLPNPAVLALNLTVSGTSAGNGTYSISDFNQVFFDTGPVALDFSKPLVGQPSCPPGGTWGPSDFCGDLNFFGNTTAPVGEDPFLLCANGGNGDCAQLVSAVTAIAVPTPALNRWTLAAITGLLALAGLISLRRYRTTQ